MVFHGSPLVPKPIQWLWLWQGIQMCIHPTVLHEPNWVPQAFNPDLTRAKLPFRGISLSIDYREANATVSYLHSDEFFLLLAFFLRVEVCCASGHISLAEHPSWSRISKVLEKRIPTFTWPSNLHAGSGLNSPGCSEVKDYMLHMGMATTGSKMPIIPNLHPLLFQAGMTQRLRKQVWLFEWYHCERVWHPRQDPRLPICCL